MFGRIFRSTSAAARNQFKQTRSLVNLKQPFSRENIPFYGAVVGLTALSFQISVLYPWHHELSDQFAAIEVSHMHTTNSATLHTHLVGITLVRLF